MTKRIPITIGFNKSKVLGYAKLEEIAVKIDPELYTFEGGFAYNKEHDIWELMEISIVPIFKSGSGHAE